MIGAVDIGGTKIAIGLVQDNRVTVRAEIATAEARVYDRGLGCIASTLAELAAREHVQLDGIGIGLTGRVNGLTRCIGRNDFLKDWEGHDLVGDLRQRFGIQVGIENDADAAALAEAAWGAGRGKARFIYLTISTGIGGGIVLDGRLYRGLEGAHPEMGHHTVDPSGPACYCGGRGCWERLASGSAMVEQARSLVKDLPEELSAKEICDLAEQGTAWAREVVAAEGSALGIGLANLVMLYAPECIALGGGVMRRWDLFASTALQLVRTRCRLVPVEKVEIVRANLGEDSALIGAAQTVRSAL